MSRTYREHQSFAAHADDYASLKLTLRNGPKILTKRQSLSTLEKSVTTLEKTTQSLVQEMKVTTTILSSQMESLFEELKKL
jgi:hypothetical protein